MGKNDFLSPKAIANRIKAKGLQKLRWYCQLCQKQCRDENGFKCHQTSDSHRRQMEILGLNPERVIEGYSEMFEQDFLEHLQRAHPFSRVSAKVVYNEFIQDRNHVHMNSTCWYTLTDFVKYLGKEGKCKVEETPKGWFITLIQKDPMKALEDEKRMRRSEAEREEEDRHMAALYEQIQRAKRARLEAGLPEDDDEGDGEEDEEARALQRDEDEGPITLSLAPAGAAAAGTAAGAAEDAAAVAAAPGLKRKRGAAAPLAAAAGAFGDDDDDEGQAGGSNRGGPTSTSAAGGGGGASGTRAMDEIMQREKQAKAQAAARAAAAAASGSGGGRGGRVDAWLSPGIIVKVMSKELKETGYYKAKGVVLRVIDRFIGELEMLDSGDVLRVDQEQLETVIPSPGGSVLIVNGPHRGTHAELLSIDEKRYKATVLALDGPYKKQEFDLDYEDICKLSKQ